MAEIDKKMLGYYKRAEKKVNEQMAGRTYNSPSERFGAKIDLQNEALFGNKRYIALQKQRE